MTTKPYLEIILNGNHDSRANNGSPQRTRPTQHGHERYEDGYIQTHGILWLNVLDITGVEGAHHTDKTGGDGVGLYFGPVHINAQGLGHMLIIFYGAELVSQLRLPKPVYVKDTKEEKT